MIGYADFREFMSETGVEVGDYVTVVADEEVYGVLKFVLCNGIIVSYDDRHHMISFDAIRRVSAGTQKETD